MHTYATVMMITYTTIMTMMTAFTRQDIRESKRSQFCMTSSMHTLQILRKRQALLNIIKTSNIGHNSFSTNFCFVDWRSGSSNREKNQIIYCLLQKSKFSLVCTSTNSVNRSMTPIVLWQVIKLQQDQALPLLVLSLQGVKFYF